MLLRVLLRAYEDSQSLTLTSWKEKEGKQKEAERGRIRKKEQIMIIFGRWIMYLYLESYRPLWEYWSPVCVTRETLSAVGLNRGQALHPISHLSAWIQPPLILSVITSVCSLCFYCNCDNYLLQPWCPVYSLFHQFETLDKQVLLHVLWLGCRRG